MATRMFDFIEERYRQDPKATLFAQKEKGKWREYSSAEIWETAQWLAGGLQDLGIKHDGHDPEDLEKIAIIANNRPEWVITDVAVQLCGAVLVPIYPTVSPHDLLFILTEAKIKKLFIANRDLYRRYKQIMNELPEIEHIFSFDFIEGVESWEGLTFKKHQPDQKIADEIKPEDLATIIYTSGTTGDPKGVMLSHRNIVSNVHDSMTAFTFAVPGDRALSFLPLNHIYERTIVYIYSNAGLSTWFAESMESIGDNLREVKPMIFTTVPRLLEKVYERIMNKASALKGIKKKLFFWALDLAKKFDNQKNRGAIYNLELKLANKLVFSKWREALGGRVKAIVTGSAACQDRLIRIFTAAEIIIMEGYGLTETSPVISVNRYESEGRMIGSIGTLIDNVEVKIAEDGELLTRGNNVMMGYFQQPEMTAEILKDGWFHTGDIGQWVDGKFLKITDRKKEIFKTSGGKYVAPQVLENKMKESSLIEQIMVVGANRKFVGALIVPSFSTMRRWLKEHNKEIPESNEELAKNSHARALMRKELDLFNKEFGHVEQVKKFTLLPNEWSIDKGEMTPTLKLKRKVIEDHFSAEIEAMYA